MPSKPVFFSFVRPINFDTVNLLLTSCNNALAQGVDQIVLLVSSGGGQLIPGFAAYNQLRGLPVELITHNTGSVNSIANIIFLAGDRRLASPTATFMFHGSSWSLTGEIPRTQIAEVLASLDADENRMKDVITSRTSLTNDEISELMARGETRDAEFALENGIVDEISDVALPPGATIQQI